MRAEAVPWRCHRVLISDALSVRGGSRLPHLLLDRSAAIPYDPLCRGGGAESDLSAPLKIRRRFFSPAE